MNDTDRHWVGFKLPQDDQKLSVINSTRHLDRDVPHRHPSRDDAPAASQPVLDAVYKQLGFVPNLHRLMSISLAALTGRVGLQGASSRTLDLKTRDGIALAVSEANGCNYCLSAHSYVASNFAKMSPEEIALNRQGRSSDSKREAAVRFAKKLIET